MTARPQGWETVIGLEIHVQLATRTKMFCGDQYEYGADPNSRVCPVCLGLPGALPVPNAAAVDLGVRAALGLGCEVHDTSAFARKNYFYPDLPKGYQITQYDRPLATGGGLPLPHDGGDVRIRRVHLEEDSGKSVHDRFDRHTALDFNRAGVPLIEVVTEPDLRSPADARAFLRRLRQLMEYLGVSDCDMEKGALRVDANVSVRPAGDDSLGTKTELKNLNSFSNVERALDHEAERQVGVLEDGGHIVHDTRLWDADSGRARPIRAKEQAHDYRYFPEPDLPPLVLDPGRVATLRRGLPELPWDRERRLIDDYDLPPYDAGVLTADRATADYFEAAARASGDPKAASNWVMGEVAAWLNEAGRGIDRFPVPPEALGELIRMAGEGVVSSSAAATALRHMAETGRSAPEVVEAGGLAQVSDDEALGGWVEQALAAHPREADRLREGETKLIGFFVGQVMRASGGSADPGRVTELLREAAERDP